MQTMSENWNASISADCREVKGKVELYQGSTLLSTFLANDNLLSIDIERNCTSGKFFGYSILQQATVKILDTQRALNVAEGQILKCYIGCKVGNSDEYVSFPSFYISSVERDENDNSLTLKGWDIMHQIALKTSSEINLVAPYTLEDYINAICISAGITAEWGFTSTLKGIAYTANNLPNLDGKENLRELINSACEVVGAIAYINKDNKLYFKKLGQTDSDIVETIGRENYFTCKAQKAFGAFGILEHDTELGDNTVVGTTGTRQIISNNPFIENRDDIQAILTTTLAVNSGLIIYPNSLEWRANPALELGDRIKIEQKDGQYLTTYLLAETLSYSGSGLTSKGEWSRAEKSYNAAPTITEAIRDTSAKVDRVNNEIQLVAQKTSSIESNVNSIQGNISTLTQSVSEKITPEQAQIIAKEELANGTSQVVTATGFTFNKDGLTITKTDSEMETLINEDGMTVSKNDTAMLVANNQGVKAVNLNASTFLIVGGRIRFENYGTDAVGCFWIGG